jgi:hypothetical protein
MLSGTDVYEWVRSGIVTGSSFSFNCYQDDWSYEDGVSCRTLVSGKLLDVGPTATPAYTDASAAVYRSLAANRNADPSDVESLAAQGELRKLWQRTDIQPAPQRQEKRIDVAQRRRELERMKAPERRDPKRLLLELHRMRMKWDGDLALAAQLAHGRP